MLWYTLLLLYIICDITFGATVKPDLIHKLVPDTSITSDRLSDLNGNLTPAQKIIYIYGPNQWKTLNNINLIEKANSDYLVTPGIGAHKLHKRKVKWNKARRICIEEGGHLAIINSNSEEKILIRILEENKESEAWIGIHDLFEEGEWNTIIDESLEATGYSKWVTFNGDEMPNNYNNEQHCGTIMDGGMNDVLCTDLRAFFCEITF